MGLPDPELVELVNDPKDDLRAAAREGLLARPKRLPPRFLYDERGSALFERISECPEYYVTRSELRVLRTAASEIAEHLGPRCALIEFGSGTSRKSRILLDALQDPSAYIPIDVSRSFLLGSVESLREEYPSLRIVPVCADFTSPGLSRLPAQVLSKVEPSRVAAFFPGSTIGNLAPPQAQAFLARAAQILGPGGMLLIGVDLIKDAEVLRSAYDDREGITARFNLNLLHRLNRETGATFDPSRFRHEARFNECEGRIEMHLVSLCDQIVVVAGEAVEFRTGESIHTENSYKYAPEGFEALALEAGFARVRYWTDPKEYFAVYLLRVDTGARLEEGAGLGAA